MLNSIKTGEGWFFWNHSAACLKHKSMPHEENRCIEQPCLKLAAPHLHSSDWGQGERQGSLVALWRANFKCCSKETESYWKLKKTTTTTKNAAVVFVCGYEHQLTLERATAGSVRVRHTLWGEDANNGSPVNTSYTPLLSISHINSHLLLSA